MLRAQWLDLDTPIGQGVVALDSTLAEDERNKIRARTNGGREAAPKRAVRFERKPKLDPERTAAAVKMVHDGKMLREVATLMAVGYSTIARALARPANT